LNTISIHCGSMLVSLGGLVGNIHPAIVHLPIGILVLACVYKLMSVKRKTAESKSLLMFTLLLGFATIILSLISGYTLSLDGGYDKDILSKHQYAAYALALVTLGWIYLETQPRFRRGAMVSMVAVLLALTVTGHLGGSITHGEGFLTGGDEEEVIVKKPVIKDVQQAKVYNDVVQPILAQKCYSCHNKSRQKGDLRLDEPIFIMKGGKDAKALEPGNADSSEIIKRMLLPVSDDDHMPPKKKPQPSEQEIAILHWWIQEGASFDKRVADLQQSPKIKPYLKQLERVVEEEEPLPEVGAPDQAAINLLKKKGVLVLPLATNSNYLEVNFISAHDVSDDDMKQLLKLKSQVIDLDAGFNSTSDSSIRYISQLNKLRRLKLNDSRVTNAGIKQLSSLNDLRYLNVKGTAVNSDGIKELAALKKLSVIYTFNSAVKPADVAGLKQLFPKTKIDTGNYNLPKLESDTSVITKAKPN